MPFDALPIRTRSLTDVVASYGIIPVPMAELLAYKQEQLAKNPADKLYRHLNKLQFGLMSLFGLSITLMAGYGIHGTVGYLLGCSGLLAFSWVTSMKIKGPACWTDHYYYHDRVSVPQDIKRLARQVVSDLPGARVMVGILTQNRVALDPYLVVRCGDEAVCLGIWDGNKIIRIAGSPARPVGLDPTFVSPKGKVTGAPDGGTGCPNQTIVCLRRIEAPWFQWLVEHPDARVQLGQVAAPHRRDLVCQTLALRGQDAASCGLISTSGTVRDPELHLV